MPEKIKAQPLPKPETSSSSAPLSAEIDKTEHRYQNISIEKVVSAGRWGLESNGLEITDLLNPDPKTTKLVGMKNKVGTVEVLIMDQKPDITVKVKPILTKKSAEQDFLLAFWEKFDSEAGLQKADAQKELEALRQGDFRTYRIEGQKAMDSLVDQARWGLESMGMKILESLRPDVSTAAIAGAGKIEKVYTEARVRIKGSQNQAVVQLLTTQGVFQKKSLWVPGAGKLEFGPSDREKEKADKKFTYEVTTFWDQLKLKFGESLEEIEQKAKSLVQRSAEDEQAVATLTDIWNKISQKDRDLGSQVANIEADLTRIDASINTLASHAKDFVSWQVIPVLQRVLQPARGKNAPYFVDLSFIQLEETSAHPAFFTFIRMGPYPISKELVITDKFLFTYEGMDFTDEMGRHLNNEEPLLAKYLRGAYFDNSLTHYYAELNVKDKDGSKYSKVIDYFLKEPIKIFNVLVGDSQQLMIIARAFISPDAKTTPQPSAFLRLMDQLVVNLERYCIKPAAMSSTEEGGGSKPSVQVALNRCPFCNWLLTPGKTVCPMCRKELPTREAEFIPPPPPPRPSDGDFLPPTVVEPPPLAVSVESPAPVGTDSINQRIQEINFQIQGLQGVLNDLQAAFTSGSIKFEQYSSSNEQYIQQIGKLQEEKRALERKKFESEFKL